MSKYYIDSLYMTILNQLQNYNWSTSNIENIKKYIKMKKKPSNVKSFIEQFIQRSHSSLEKEELERETSKLLDEYNSKFSENFYIRNDKLYYKPLNLQIVPKDDEERKQIILKKHFHGPEGIGKGQNNFHHYILSKYLGITRDDVIAFLKNQPEYQLFQNKPRMTTSGIEAKYPLHIVAIDTVDIRNMRTYYNYIFSAMDIYTGFCWFFLSKAHEARDSIEGLKKLLSYNLRFRDRATRENMIANNRFDLPHMIISDQGAEFQKEFSEYLRTMKIKQKMQKSYTPQPHIEAVNGVLRNIIRAHVIRSGKKTLTPAIMEKLMTAKNTNTDPDSRTTSEALMKDYFSRSSDGMLRELVKNKTSKKRQKYANKTRRYKNQNLNTGDFVRVKLANFQPGIRSLVKSGETKKIFVRFSPEVYIVEKVIQVQRNNFGLPLYILKDSQNRVILNASGKKRIFQGSDLLKVPGPGGIERKPHLTLKQVNKLNSNERGRDLYIEPNAPDSTVSALSPFTASPSEGVVREKPVSEWKGGEWTKALKDKEFTDNEDGIRRIIIKVVYDHTDNVYRPVCVEKGKKNIKENHQYYLLKEVLDMASGRGEAWVEERFYEGTRIDYS